MHWYWISTQYRPLPKFGHQNQYREDTTRIGKFLLAIKKWEIRGKQAALQSFSALLEPPVAAKHLCDISGIGKCC